MTSAVRFTVSLFLATFFLLLRASAAGQDPKPKPENTISVHLGEPVPAQKFANPPKFWISDVIDRSGNPQPMLVLKERGGIFLDRQPTVIVREALEESLRAANLLAMDANSADLVLKIYLFQFGLAQGSQLDFFGKVEFTAMVKNLKSGESLEVKAAGTSIAKVAVRKKNIQKNVQDDVEESLRDAVRNFLRGQQLKDAVGALRKSTDAAPAPTPNP
ncbi:MAG: hypothetical protein ABSE19_13280 [Candidatus Acidiferrum sp.]